MRSCSVRGRTAPQPRGGGGGCRSAWPPGLCHVPCLLLRSCPETPLRRGVAPKPVQPRPETFPSHRYCRLRLSGTIDLPEGARQSPNIHSVRSTYCGKVSFAVTLSRITETRGL